MLSSAVRSPMDFNEIENKGGDLYIERMGAFIIQSINQRSYF